jgi:phosphoribosylformylglycinamidine synthase
MGQAIKVCVAHGEGNYVSDPQTMERLEGEDLIAFRYCDEAGKIDDDSNPNGAINSIAGIYSPNLRVLGMMPHPENLIDPLVGGTDGRGLFESLAIALDAAA